MKGKESTILYLLEAEEEGEYLAVVTSDHGTNTQGGKAFAR